MQNKDGACEPACNIFDFDQPENQHNTQPLWSCCEFYLSIWIALSTISFFGVLSQVYDTGLLLLAEVSELNECDWVSWQQENLIVSFLSFQESIDGVWLKRIVWSELVVSHLAQGIISRNKTWILTVLLSTVATLRCGWLIHWPAGITTWIHHNDPESKLSTCKLLFYLFLQILTPISCFFPGEAVSFAVPPAFLPMFDVGVSISLGILWIIIQLLVGQDDWLRSLDF